MKYVQINAYATGWADSIIFQKHRQLIKNGVESWVFWGRSGGKEDAHCKRIATTFENCLDGFLTRINGRPGFYSWTSTARLLKALDAIQPDIVHLHLLLGYYINVEMLFNWLSRQKCQVYWTLHDCWAVTGHCTYFTAVQCDQWKTGCENCPQQNTYPETFFRGREHLNFLEKKRLFTMLPPEQMKLIVPSRWLKGIVEQSYLAKYPIEIRYNTIDKSIFKPTASDIKAKYCQKGEFLILGVASKWSERKGLKDFIRLSELFKGKCKIVLVGVSEKQMKELPSNIVALTRMSNKEELVKLYSAADVFFNPTKEDNYPTVNLEAEACGTPVITYSAGGSAETIKRDDSKAVNSFEDAVVVFQKLMGYNNIQF